MFSQASSNLFLIVWYKKGVSCNSKRSHVVVACIHPLQEIIVQGRTPLLVVPVSIFWNHKFTLCYTHVNL